MSASRLTEQVTQLKTLETRPLSEQAYVVLRNRILTGALPHGSRLNIDTAASELGISGTPVRDAINRLALDGLVQVRRRLGTIVIGFSPKEVQDINQFRLLLEPSICEHVAANASDEFIHGLQVSVQELEAMDLDNLYEDVDRYLAWAENNQAFHTRIAAEMRNPQIDATISRLFMNPGLASRVIGSTYQGPIARRAEHKVIVEAIASRDPQRSRAAMHAHLTSGRRDLIGFLTGEQE